MQLRAATKQTDANFVGVIRKNVQSFKVVTNDSIGTCSSALYSLLFPKAAAKGSKRCHQRLSLKTAQSFAEVMAVLKDCHQRLPKSSAEVMAVFK